MIHYHRLKGFFATDTANKKKTSTFVFDKIAINELQLP